MAKLALIRHGQSEWNALDLWTGSTDVVLTEKGHQEAKHVGEVLKSIHWDLAYTSALKRSVQTLDDIKLQLNQTELPTYASPALNERDYGNFDGMNKVKIEEEYGYEMFEKWHRSWDYPLPHGETLKDVFMRVVPNYEAEILPKLKEGKNVLISAHGNSLRALIKFIEDVPEDEIPYLEIATGEIYLYDVDSDGKVVAKEARAARENTV